MSTDLDPLLKRRHLANVDELDFSYESSLRLTTVGSLLSPDFVTDGRSVIIEGKPGRGKTHLAIAIRVPRIAARLRCADPTTAAQLIEELSASSRDGKLHDALTPYVKPHVLVVDEAGYLAYGDDAPNVLYHVVRSGTPAPPRRALDGTKHLPDAGPPREHLSRDDDEHRAASGARPRATMPLPSAPFSRCGKWPRTLRGSQSLPARPVDYRLDDDPAPPERAAARALTAEEQQVLTGRGNPDPRRRYGRSPFFGDVELDRVGTRAQSIRWKH